MPKMYYTEEEVKEIRLSAVDIARGYHNLVGLANSLYDVIPLLDTSNIAVLKRQESELIEIMNDFTTEFGRLLNLDAKVLNLLDKYETDRSLSAVPGINARIRQKLSFLEYHSPRTNNL